MQHRLNLESCKLTRSLKEIYPTENQNKIIALLTTPALKKTTDVNAKKHGSTRTSQGIHLALKFLLLKKDRSAAAASNTSALAAGRV